MELYINQLKDFQFDIDVKTSHRRNKDGSYKTFYCNNILTFDIETTSAFIEDGKVIPYTKGKSNDYWNELEPVALCYIWQFSIDDKVYYGRELKDFVKVIEDIPSWLNCIIWVHNLSWEFQFLLNILDFTGTFAKNPHKPMKTTLLKYPKIQFRCSYMLTRLSLESWGKQIGIEKAVGFLDYDIIRTPLTPLTKEELFYCERDCIVVYKGIQQYVKKYGSQFKIPLTQTGTVRQEVKELLTSNPEYVKKIKKLVPANAEEYKMLQNIFAGGYCHANRLYSGETIEGIIEHYDFASSYPTVMIAEKYPMTEWYMAYDLIIPPDEEFEDTAYIFKLKFNQLNSISYNTYIQASKCEGKGYTFDNGRIIHADELTIMCTEQDWITIRNNYKWESVEVLEALCSDKDYLPRDFTNYILDLYSNKTKYKDVAGYEDIYMQSKQYINSMFGMCVTAIVQADVVFNGTEWITNKLTEAFVNNKLDSLRWYNPREKRYFLNFSWGLYVTAYARANLWRCIERCGNLGRDVLYVDTDSIFAIGKHDFSWYNEEITNKLKKACKINNLDFEKTRPKTPKGIEKPLGIFDKEDDCIQFKTLGAKRYVERRENDGKLHLTVSGINKQAVELLNDNIDNFKNGFNFDKDAECVTKKLSTYICDMPDVVFPDGYVSKYKYGINLRRIGYELTITDEYEDIMKYSKMYLEDIDENVINSLKGVWIE